MELGFGTHNAWLAYRAWLWAKMTRRPVRLKVSPEKPWQKAWYVIYYGNRRTASPNTGE